MAPNPAQDPAHEPARQLSAMMAQLVRQNQMLAGHVDRMATGLGDLAKDTRSGFRTVGAGIEGLRAEMTDRLRAAGTRFDDLDERLGRVEDGMKQVHSDLLQLQNDILAAQQSALHAHLRLDDRAEDGEEPSP